VLSDSLRQPRSTHGMNQPKLSILGFSSRKPCTTRLTHQRAVRRTLEAANRRPVTATIARISHFLLDTNRPSRRIFSTTGSLRHPCTATVPSSHSSLAVSHCLFHENLNRQLRRLEIALSPRKQTTALCSNRQLSPSSRATSHQSLTTHQSRRSIVEPRP
jgi:hypothetical protein